MEIPDIIAKYMENRYYPEEYDTFIQNNRLDLIYGNYAETAKYIKDKHINKILYFNNKNKILSAEKVLHNIDSVLHANGISTIHFKGITLGTVLYDDSNLRMCGDLDFLVENKNFDRALDLLCQNGFEKISQYDGHHIALGKNDVIVEMHTSLFHPKNNISFSLTDDDLKYVTINGHDVLTMNETALFVYLLYHHYAHCINDTIFSDFHYFHHYYKKRGVMSIYRYFDIAILIKKFEHVIDWQHCMQMLLKTELRTEFKMLLQEFDSIFSGFLPEEFLRAMYEKEYEESCSYYVFNYIYKQLKKGSVLKYDDILSEIANQNVCNRYEITCGAYHNPLRFCVDEYALHKMNPNGSYVQSGKAPIDANDLSFYFDMWIQDESLVIHLDVYNDHVVCIPRGSVYTDSANVIRCDSVTISIVQANDRYQFNEFIILLEEDTRGQIVPVIYDDLLHIRKDSQAEMKLTLYGYQLECKVPLSCLGISYVTNNFFYFDLAVSDCDSISHQRKTTLALSAPEEFYCDPRRFAKAIIVL